MHCIGHDIITELSRSEELKSISILLTYGHGDLHFHCCFYEFVMKWKNHWMQQQLISVQKSVEETRVRYLECQSMSKNSENKKLKNVMFKYFSMQFHIHWENLHFYFSYSTGNRKKAFRSLNNMMRVVEWQQNDIDMKLFCIWRSAIVKLYVHE